MKILVALIFFSPVIFAQNNSQLKFQALQGLAQIQKYEKQQAALMEGQLENIQELEEAIVDLKEAAEKLSRLVQGSGRNDLIGAVKHLQQMQTDFNLQYQQLQSQMQRENRSYTSISNIMKTKHDTVKNSISNIR